MVGSGGGGVVSRLTTDSGEKWGRGGIGVGVGVQKQVWVFKGGEGGGGGRLTVLCGW